MTSDETLSQLLTWRALQEKEGRGQSIAVDKMLLQILKKLSYTGERELTRYLREVFDALFDLLSSRTNNKVLNEVFMVLCRILDSLNGKRGSHNLAPMLDIYINSLFAPRKYGHKTSKKGTGGGGHNGLEALQFTLLGRIKHLMDWLENPDLNKRTRDPERQALNLCMKNFSFIIRFAIIAWEEDNAEESGISSRQSRVSVASIDNSDSDPFTQSLLEVMYYVDAL